VVADLKIVEADSKTALMTYNRAREEEGPEQGNRAKLSTDGEASNGGQSRKDSQRIQEKGYGVRQWSHGSLITGKLGVVHGRFETWLSQ